nr:MAG TPA: hypothetical protein [Inoviridae sp.]
MIKHHIKTRNRKVYFIKQIFTNKCFCSFIAQTFSPLSCITNKKT